MAANNVIEAITQVAGSPSLIHGNLARFRIDPTTGGLLVHIVAGGGGSGGTAVSISDGQDFTQGSQADASATSDTGTFSLVALTKRQLEHLTDILAADGDILSELQGLRSVIGNTDDGAATSDTATDTQVALFKRLLERITILIDQDVPNGTAAILPSEARVAGATSDDIPNPKWRGAHFVIEVTETTGSPSVTFEVQARNTTSGNYYRMLISDPIVATGTHILKIYPGIPPSPNRVSSDVLPSVFRVVTTHDNGDSITYSVDAMGVV